MVDLKKKPYCLSDAKIRWVEESIKSMSLEEKIGQLFVHMTGNMTDEEAIKAEIEQTRMGGIRFNPKTKEEMWEMNRLFQKHSRIPVLSAVNVEAGGNGASSDGTNVGQQLKIAATGDEEYAYKMGQICGRETKATGSNWAFAPIVDIDLNWHNPVISTRTFGSDPELVLKMSKAYFKGISESGVVCAMKHFPGDGLDERDQHVATSVNSYSCEEWDATFGMVYRGMIEAGVQAVMTGHIMQPAYQKRFNPKVKDDGYLPATICRELTTDLLRGKLGFNGLVVTDASHMVGLAGRGRRRDIVPGAIMAGNDMFLFFNDIDEDLGYMTEAYKDGRLTEERLMDALRRILGLKALVGLDAYGEDSMPPKEGLSVIGCPEHREVSAEVSDKALTLVKHVGPEIFPVTSSKYRRILLVPVGPASPPALVMAGMGVDGSKLAGKIKAKLEERGHEVEIYTDPLQKLVGQKPEDIKTMMADMAKKLGGKGAYGGKQSIAALTGSHDLVICVANVSATMRTTQRLEWAISKGGWDNPWYVNELPVIFVSFNCPFHLADVSQVKNFINCYDAHDTSIDSFVKKIAGEGEFTGVSPVDAFCGLMDTRF